MSDLKKLFSAGYHCGYYDGKEGHAGLLNPTWENDGGGYWDEEIRMRLNQRTTPQAEGGEMIKKITDIRYIADQYDSRPLWWDNPKKWFHRIRDLCDELLTQPTESRERAGGKDG